MPPEINALVADARRRFRAAGIPQEEAALDARLLAQHLLHWDATRLMTHGDEPATHELMRDYEALVRRRIGREPLAYITGCREFWNIAIDVTPAVLIPRPETELLVEAALDLFDHRQPLRILDLCTGSGCLAVALAREFPRASVAASDISTAALEVACRNVKRYALTSRVRVIQGDLLADIEGPFELIVCNPPYVPAIDAPSLQPEVRKEPAAALFAGDNGLEIIERLLAEAPGVLAGDGVLIFEFGAGQLEGIERAVQRTPALSLVDVRRDLQDIPRAAIVARASR